MPLFNRKDKSRYASFTRRTLLLGGGMSAVFAVLAGRLYELQILEGQEYETAAEDNRINQRLIAPLRGRILDRFGTELANNRRNYRVLLIPEQATDGVDAALASIGRVIQITSHQHEKILHDIAQNKKFVPVTVVENLTWDEFALINLHLPYLPGVQPDVGETRAYPYASEMAHVLGYVAAVSPEEKSNDDDPLVDLPGFRVGKRGIEKEFEYQIRGKAGTSRVEVNAYGRVIRELGRDPGVPGKDVYLTIDRQVQAFVTQRMGDQSAACVVMDAATGDVLALASTPAFDPNLFNGGITQPQWHDLLNNDHHPLMNKAITGAYPPGSTFKTAMALAAADNGMADLTVNCTGSMRLGDHTFYCDAWRIGGHGHVNLPRGIQVSCDVFFYEVARRLGIDKMAQAANAMGLGLPTGIELPGESGGLIPTRAWKMKRFGVPWQQGETLVSGIGQGYVLTTPIQLCTLAARIATGKAIVPRLAHQVGTSLEPRPLPAALPFSEQAFALVRQGMTMAVNAPGGTAYGWRINQPGLEMAGKTGTAQVRRITREERANGLKPQSEMPWKDREHALFISFAPADNPRYALAIVIEHGGARNEPQVEFARDIMLFTQQRDPLKMRAAYPVNAAGMTASFLEQHG
ncbi:MAG TPA: penicillin-binding protein 2 [Rhizomicrobium sp.]|jgi:penicillin-binding protein 2|nr:penicillin-binding protein 2 [Rhizomicrobium sp.]